MTKKKGKKVFHLTSKPTKRKSWRHSRSRYDLFVCAFLIHSILKWILQMLLWNNFCEFGSLRV